MTKYLSSDPFSSKPSSPEYEEGWERVFGRKKAEAPPPEPAQITIPLERYTKLIAVVNAVDDDLEHANQLTHDRLVKALFALDAVMPQTPSKNGCCGKRCGDRCVK